MKKINRFIALSLLALLISPASAVLANPAKEAKSEKVEQKQSLKSKAAAYVREHKLQVAGIGATVIAAVVAGVVCKDQLLGWFKAHSNDTNLSSQTSLSSGDQAPVTTSGSQPASISNNSNLKIVEFSNQKAAFLLEQKGFFTSTRITLDKAAKKYPKETLVSLLKPVQNLNNRMHGYTPLEWATAKNQPEVADLLLSAGALATGQALLDAAKRGANSIVKKLIEEGVDIDHSYYYDCQTALHYAASNGHLEVVQTLLGAKANADADATKHYYDTRCVKNPITTPFYLALQKGHLKVAKVLRPRTTIGVMKAICDALGENNLTIDQLAQIGVAIDDVDKDRNTLLHTAANCDKYESREEIWVKTNTVDALLKNGADATLKNNRGQIAADLAEHEDVKNIFTRHAKTQQTKVENA